MGGSVAARMPDIDISTVPPEFVDLVEDATRFR
jgi:hypothetical protein